MERDAWEVEGRKGDGEESKRWDEKRREEGGGGRAARGREWSSRRGKGRGRRESGVLERREEGEHGRGRGRADETTFVEFVCSNAQGMSGSTLIYSCPKVARLRGAPFSGVARPTCMCQPARACVGVEHTHNVYAKC